MKHISITLSPDQISEIRNLVRFRRDFSDMACICQEYDDFLSYLVKSLDDQEKEFLANGYCTDDSEVTA